MEEEKREIFTNVFARFKKLLIKQGANLEEREKRKIPFSLTLGTLMIKDNAEEKAKNILKTM